MERRNIVKLQVERGTDLRYRRGVDHNPANGT